MSLETPSPPGSYGLGPHRAMVMLESSPVPWFCLRGGPKPTLPTCVEHCNPPKSQMDSPKHGHPSRSSSLLGWTGWLRASAAGHGTATQPPPASCQSWGGWPSRALCSPGCCPAQAPCLVEGGMLSTEQREHKLLWKADPWADLLYQRQTKKKKYTKKTT